jgi:phage terminase small subunit
VTPKQLRFVEEYLIDLNATQAAIRAGYESKNADVVASQNLARTDVALRINERIQERSKRAEITADRVLVELGKLAFVNMADFYDMTSNGTPVLNLSKITRDQAAALTEITVEDTPNGQRVKFKLADKRAALVDLAKHLGIMTDKSELKVTHSLEELIGRSLKTVTDARQQLPAPVTIENDEN